MLEAYRFFREYYREKVRIYCYIICSLLAKICLLIIPYLTKVLIDQIQYQNFKLFKEISILLIGSMFLFAIFLSTKYYFQNYIETEILNQIKKEMLVKIFKVKHEEIAKISIGELIQKIFNDTDVIKPLIISTIIEFIINIVYVISIVCIMFFMNQIMTFILLLLIPVFILFYKIYIPRIKQISGQIINQDEKIKCLAEEIITGSLDIKVNSAYSFIEKRIVKHLNKYFDLILTKTKYMMKYDYILVTGIMNLATLLIYCFGGYLVFNNIISIGTLISFNLYFSKLWTPVEYFMDFSKEVKVQLLSLKRIQDFLQIEEEKQMDKIKLPEYTGLKIENLSFSYDDRIIFDKLNLELGVGEIIGIKGGNGSGKSTLASILTKLLDNYEGNIYYGDINYKELDARSIREKIIYIPPKSFFFNGSIIENITLMPLEDKNCTIQFNEKVDIKFLMDILKNNQKDLTTLINNQVPLLSSGEQKIIQILEATEINFIKKENPETI